jgi:heptosyltransferase-2
MTERRLLVRGVNWLGDAVMTTPALRRLREALPDTRISLLTHAKLHDLWRNHPGIDEVLTFSDGEKPWVIGRRLRAANFTTALILPNSPRSALEMWFARVPRRIGYERPWRNWLLTRRVAARPGRLEMRKLSDAEVRARIEAGRRAGKSAPRAPLPASAHQMHEYLHLATALGANPNPTAPKLTVLDQEVREVERTWLSRTQAANADREPTMLLGLNPGAEYGPAKRWPAERFAAVARAVSARKRGVVWFVFGGPADHESGEAIAKLAGDSVYNVAGKTSLREFMALLKLCRVLLTNDTGPMHIAAALGTPVVVPFGSTSPELTGPGLPGDPRNALIRGEAPCAPCFRRTCPIDFRCMTSISVERVTADVLAAI